MSKKMPLAFAILTLTPTAYGAQQPKLPPPPEARAQTLTEEDKEILKHKEVLENLELLKNLEQIKYLDFLKQPKGNRPKEKEKSGTKVPTKDNGSKIK